MKLFILITAITLTRAAKLDRVYLPPDVQSSAGSNFLEAPRQSNGFQDQTIALTNRFPSQNAFAQSEAFSGFETRPERAQAAFERNAAILRQDNSNNGETYAYAYETENGIYGEENGVATNGVQAQGGYSYTGDDGKVYSVRYTADENGFRPQGDHLPTPPPIPEEIQRALEKNAREEAAGIYDDGAYIESEYNSNNQQQNFINKNGQGNENNNFNSVVANNALLTAGNYGIAGIQNTYLPPFNQQNDVATSGSTTNGVQNAYLPPIADRSNQGTSASQFSFNSNALNNVVKNSAITGVQKTYLPPFGQRNNQRGEVRQSTVNNNVYARNDAAKVTVANVQKTYLPPFTQQNDKARNGDGINGVQKAYLPPTAELNNQYLAPTAELNNQRAGAQQPSFNRNALGGRDAVENYSPITRGQNAYLPPFGQRNNQRGEVRQSITNVQKNYLPPSTQYNDIAKSDSPINGGLKAYLPPFAQRNNQGIDKPIFNNNALSRNDAAESGSTFAETQNAYLPPFAQRNNQEADGPIINNNALSRNDAAEIGSAFAGIQNAYLPPFAQRKNQETDGPIFNNNALSRNDAAESSSTFAGIQNANLPPFTQRNNKDTENPIFNNNALSRNDAAEIGTAFAGIQNAYLPPFGTRIARQATASNPSADKNTSGNGSKVPGANNQYLPPTLGFAQLSLDRLSSHKNRF